MTVTATSFRTDLPEFASQAVYPTGVISYWIAIAQLLFGVAVGSQPKVCSFVGALAANKVLTVSEVDFGSLSLFPLAYQGNNLPTSAAITGQLTGAPGGIGTYQSSVAGNIAAEPMVAYGNPTGQAGNPFWGPSSPTADTPPTTLVDFATEMWVAHQIVLEKQAIATAAAGGDPGTKIGIISNKSVNGVSVGFDIGAVTGGNMQANAGYYNSTVYGIRFYRLMKLRGAGPIQLGIGRPPPFLFFNNFGYLGSSNAWAGPWPGISQGDTGFGS
jgi:hypothetical protein